MAYMLQQRWKVIVLVLTLCANDIKRKNNILLWQHSFLLTWRPPTPLETKTGQSNPILKMLCDCEISNALTTLWFEHPLLPEWGVLLLVYVQLPYWWPRGWRPPAGWEVCVVWGLVWAARGAERTEEPWTWVTGGAPPGSTAQHPSHLISYISTDRGLSNGGFEEYEWMTIGSNQT